MASRPVADPAMEAYAAEHSTHSSERLRAVAASTRAFSAHPDMMIDATEARLLALLVAVSGARSILEVGTFTGVSALSMAEALPAEGHTTSLELSPEHAAKAAEHISSAGLGERISIIEGPALESLARLAGPFDLVFIDADKPGYPAYLEAVVPLVRAGGLIIADNVLRGGRVLDADDADPGIRAMRAFNDRAASDPRLEAVMLTIRDGVTLMRRLEG
ncbi:class I SAM-dependent methyltransferase [soil metagenome]